MRLRNDRREVRKKEGAERLEAWQSLTTAEKIASLKTRRGNSARQMKKLAPEA